MEQNKEIGGFIEFEYFHGEEFHKNAIALNIARNCLAYIVIAKKIKHLHLPYF